MAHGLETIDWTAPWLAPWRQQGLAIAQQVNQSAVNCADALNARCDLQGSALQPAVRFVPQFALLPNEAYESFIFRTRQVPTRNGLHDFFNGLCWLQFPATKLRLNQLQAAHISSHGVQPVRGPARDALTIFDENAAFLQCPDALWHALAAKDWQALFVGLRPLWAQSSLVLFGHALLEKLVAPRKSITAHVYRVHAQDRSLAAVDAWMAADLSAEKLATKPFAHLPVLGVPHWWAANEDLAFYADATVFRAPRVADITPLQNC